MGYASYQEPRTHPHQENTNTAVPCLLPNVVVIKYSDIAPILIEFPGQNLIWDLTGFWRDTEMRNDQKYQYVI